MSYMKRLFEDIQEITNYRRKMFNLSEEVFIVEYNIEKINKNEELDEILEVVEDCYDEAFEFFKTLVNSRVKAKYIDYLSCHKKMRGDHV